MISRHRLTGTRLLFRSVSSRRNVENSPRSNGPLIAFLQNKLKKIISDESFQVRVVPDPLLKLKKDATTESPLSGVVQIQQAIAEAQQHGRDLLEVSLDQDIPVLTITDMKQLEYLQRKKTKANVTTQIPMKEVLFRVNIAENDFERKIGLVRKFLDNGHTCQINVRAQNRYLKTSPDIVSTRMEEIKDTLEEFADILTPPALNDTERKHLGNFRVRPKSASSSKNK